MFKKILMTGAALAALTGAASAADLPLRTAPPVFTPPVPIFTWTGAYFGINAGYAFSNDTRFRNISSGDAVNQNALVTNVRPASFRTSDDGFTAGGQVGYNYQFGPGNGIVVGVEADTSYTDLDKTGSNLATVGNAVYTNRFHGGLDYLGTVRGRVGYAFQQFMVYGTGGFAFGEVNRRATFFDGTGAVAYSGRQSNMQTGYAYGGGVEYALPTGSFLNFFKSSAVTLKAEYIHYDLGSDNLAINGQNGNPGSFNSRVETSGELARIGLNYKF